MWPMLVLQNLLVLLICFNKQINAQKNFQKMYQKTAKNTLANRSALWQ